MTLVKDHQGDVGSLAVNLFEITGAENSMNVSISFDEGLERTRFGAPAPGVIDEFMKFGPKVSISKFPIPSTAKVI
jgi:hypothetical protein